MDISALQNPLTGRIVMCALQAESGADEMWLTRVVKLARSEKQFSLYVREYGSDELIELTCNSKEPTL